MAVLSKIRQRSFLVIAIVGLALFAFIIGALIENGGFGQSSRNAGTINGVDIPFEGFRAKVDAAQKNQQAQGQAITLMQATNGVWDQEVKRVLLEDQYEKLGLRIGDDQLINIIKDSPDFSQNPQFLNAAGKFDKAKFNEFIASIKKSSPERWQQWLDYEKQLTAFTKEQMYYTMIKSGFVTTQADAKFAYGLENNKVSFDVVVVPYSTIDDKTVEPTDSELIAYMKKNEKKYKADESREIEYVMIEDKPSAEDEKVVKDKVNGLLNSSVVYNAATGKNDTVAGFRNTSNVIDFVNANSDIKYDSTYVPKSKLPAEHADALFNLAPGQVYGPYMLGNFYCMTRSLGKKAAANAKASHILISYKGAERSQSTRTKEEAQAKANEILAQATANPSSFPMLAFTNSDDSSKQQGGDLGYFSKGQMTKKFEDFAFNNPVGKIGLVETEFGFHIITVTDKQDAIRLATVAQKIAPSEATSDSYFTQATKLEMAANNKPFAEAAKDLKLTVAPIAKMLALDESVQGIGNQREIVRWAFAGKEGDVKRFNIPAGHVVARLKKINEVGLLTLDEARIAIGPKLRNEKKAAKIKEKMTGATLEAVSKTTGSPIKEALDVVAANAFIQTIGAEPKVVGTAFALKAGKVSEAIEGNAGVFKIKVKSTVKAPAPASYDEQVARLNGQSKGSVSGRVYNSLKKDAEIEDNRAQFN